jgi:hypothetical protein
MLEPAAAQKATDSGTGLMVRKTLGLKSARELSGAALCMQEGAATNTTLAELILASFGT